VLNLKFFILTRGDAPRFARRLPLAIIFRAFGAFNAKQLCLCASLSFASLPQHFQSKLDRVSTALSQRVKAK